MNKITIINISLGIFIAAAVALILSDIAAYRLSHLFTTTKSASAAPPAKQVNEDFASFAPIVDKGLFGKETQGKLTQAAKTIAPTGQAPVAASAGDLILLGTAVGSYRETFALVQRPATREERVFRLGEKVFDVGPLLAVKKDSAVILAGAKRVTLATPAAPGAGSQPPPTPAPRESQMGGLATQVGAGAFVVDQRALNAALDNIGQTMTDARLLPSMKDGKVEGFRLSEVKSGGVFGMLGMRNGDVLLSLNDFPVDSPDKALQSFVSLKGQSKLKVDIIRDNHPVTLNYDVR